MKLTDQSWGETNCCDLKYVTGGLLATEGGLLLTDYGRKNTDEGRAAIVEKIGLMLFYNIFEGLSFYYYSFSQGNRNQNILPHFQTLSTECHHFESVCVHGGGDIWHKTLLSPGKGL